MGLQSWDKAYKGKYGEKIACQHLANLGYKIVAKNWKQHRFEIDIIALDQDILVFVEVKLRNTQAFGPPSSFVSENQKEHIAQGANQYIERNAYRGEIRFDIIGVLVDDSLLEPSVEHIIDAFYIYP